jgi:hypothetical protein
VRVEGGREGNLEPDKGSGGRGDGTAAHRLYRQVRILDSLSPRRPCV